MGGGSIIIIYKVFVIVDKNNSFFYIVVYNWRKIMTEDIKMTLGYNLKYIRFQKGWSQSFVCRQIGVSIRTLSRAETGCSISKKTLNKLCVLYQMPMNCLYKDQGQKNISNHKPVDLIPDSVITRLILGSDFFMNIQREAILRFNDSIQSEALMMREDIERVLPDIISNKKTYSIQDIIFCNIIFWAYSKFNLNSVIDILWQYLIVIPE